MRNVGEPQQYLNYLWRRRSRRVGSGRDEATTVASATGRRVVARADVSTSLPLATDFTCRNYVNINGQSQQVIFLEISFFVKKRFSVLEQNVLKSLVLEFA